MKDKLVVKVTAEGVYKRKLLLKAAKISLSAILLFLLIMYSVLYIVNETGYFTIIIDRNSADSLLLSSTRDFSTTEVNLRANSPESMDNISELWLPPDINDHEGDNSGKDYIAYTFFIKNDSQRSVDYEASINIRSVTKNVDEAVRVKVYHNDEPTVFAKLARDGNPEPGTVPFTSNTRVMGNIRRDFEPEEIDKYTVVIWLEGDDPECTDEIIGGFMNMYMLIRLHEE